MAAQSSKGKLLKTKIEELGKLRNQVNHIVDQVTKDGTSWIESQGSEGSYQDINRRLESSIDVLCEVVDKMYGTATAADSSMSEASAATPTSPGTSIAEMISRMDALEKKGQALHGQIQSLDEGQRQYGGRLTKLEKVRQDDKMGALQKKVTDLHSEVSSMGVKLQTLDKGQRQHEGRLTNSEGRLTQLEKVRQDDRKAMDKLRAEMENMTMSSSSSGGAVGAGPVLDNPAVRAFTASWPAGSQPLSLTHGQTVTAWTEVTDTLGGHYDLNTGQLTVPVSGQYKLCLSHTQCHTDRQGYIGLYVRRQLGAGGECEWTECRTETWVGEWGGMSGERLQHTRQDVVKLDVGDRLWVWVGRSGGVTVRASAVTWSCELLEES